MKALKNNIKNLLVNNNSNLKNKNIEIFFNHQKKNITFSEKIDKRLLKFDTSNNETVSKLLNSIDDLNFDYFITTDSNLKQAIKNIKKNITTLTNIYDLDDSEVKNNKFLLFFHTDDLYIEQVKRIVALRGKLSIFKIWGDKHFGSFKFIWSDSNALLAINDRLKLDESLDNLWSKNNYYTKKTFKELGLQQNIIQVLSMTKDLDGDYVEIGVLAGSSLLTTLNYLRRSNSNRMSYGLDTFEGFNYEKASNSSVSYWENTHKLGNYNKVMEKISLVLDSTHQKYKLFKCDICKDQLPVEISKISVGYIDVDMFEPTKDALDKISPKIVKNGVIICEDPTSTPGLIESYIALKMFLETKEGSQYSIITLSNVYILIKNK